MRKTRSPALIGALHNMATMFTPSVQRHEEAMVISYRRKPTKNQQVNLAVARVLTYPAQYWSGEGKSPMWKMAVGLVCAAGVASLMSAGFVQAADLRARISVARHPHIHARYCGPCGCLGVAYVYHRELESTYGLGFDPRNYDTTEPHFYWGRMRAWPRYFVEAGPRLCHG